MIRFSAALAALVFATAAGAQQWTAPMLPHSGATAATPFTAKGAASSASTQQRAGHMLNVIDDFGAYADGQVVGVTATIATGSASLAVGSPLFSPADIGKVIGVSGAGVTQSYGSIVSIPLSTNAASCSGSTPPAITISGGGSYASAVFVWSLASASLASGGAGYSNGTQTLTLASGGGAAAQISVTVSGGAVTAVNSVSVAGAFELQSLLTGVAAISGGGSPTTPATFNLTVSTPSSGAATFLNSGGLYYPTSGAAAVVSGGSCATAPVTGAPVVAAQVNTLGATIIGFTDSQHITLSATASTTLSAASAQITYGHDDGAAFASCAATKACLVPAATYLVGAAAIPTGGALIGRSAPSYAGYVAGNPSAGQTLAPVSPTIIASPLAAEAFWLSGANQVRLEGLFIDCVDQQRDGVSSGSALLHMQSVTINRCNYGLGSSSGSPTSFYTEDATLVDNQLSNNVMGLTNLIDTSVVSGALTANYVGAYLGSGALGDTFTSVRVEWNYAHGLFVFQGGSLTILGGLFDRNANCGLYLNGATAVQIEGVQFHRNGSNNDFTFLANAHWCFQQGGQITFYNVQVATGVNDNGAGTLSPLYVGAFNTGAAAPNGVAIHGALGSGYTSTLWAYPPSSGFEYSGLGVDEYRNSQRPYIANGEVVQTINTGFASIGVGATQSITLGQSPLTTNYTAQSRELILSAVNYNSPYQTYACRVTLMFYRTTSVGTPAESPCYGEAGTSGTFTWGASSELQGSISGVASNGSSFTLSVKNGGSDGSNWGLWAELH